MFNKIYEIVSIETGMTKKEILLLSRRKEYVIARALFSILCIKCGISTVMIARETKKDHTTILHHYKTNIETDFIKDILIKYKNEIKEIRNGVFELTPKKVRFLGVSNSKKAYKEIYIRHNGKCMVCGFDEVVEIHHIIPRYLDGSDELSNLALLCPNHHALANRGMIQIKGVMELIHSEDAYPQV